MTARSSLRRSRPRDAKPRRYTGASDGVRQQVWDRCGGRCERCGDALSGAVSLHHRKARRMGGTTDPAVNLASNLMFLCGSGTTGCHGWIESHRRDAYAHGWLVGSHEDPARTPVYVYGRGPVLLTTEGRYSLVMRDDD